MYVFLIFIILPSTTFGQYGDPVYIYETALEGLRGRHIVDFDGDDVDDLVLLREVTRNTYVTVYRTVGDQLQFLEEHELAGGLYSGAPKANHFVDFDGDGDLDYLKGGTLYEYRSDTYELVGEIGERSFVKSEVFDFDNDGDLDIMPGYDANFQGQLGYYENQNDLNFEFTLDDDESIFVETSVYYAANIDGDEYVDIVQCRGDYVSIYEDEGDGYQYLDQINVENIIVGDLDGDGLDEIVDISQTTNGEKIYVYKWNSEEGRLVPDINDFDSSFIRDLQVVDMDGDGDSEIMYRDQFRLMILDYEENGFEIASEVELSENSWDWIKNDGFVITNGDQQIFGITTFSSVRLFDYPDLTFLNSRLLEEDATRKTIFFVRGNTNEQLVNYDYETSLLKTGSWNSTLQKFDFTDVHQFDTQGATLNFLPSVATVNGKSKFVIRELTNNELFLIDVENPFPEQFDTPIYQIESELFSRVPTQSFDTEDQFYYDDGMITKATFQSSGVQFEDLVQVNYGPSGMAVFDIDGDGVVELLFIYSTRLYVSRLEGDSYGALELIYESANLIAGTFVSVGGIMEFWHGWGPAIRAVSFQNQDVETKEYELEEQVEVITSSSRSNYEKVQVSNYDGTIRLLDAEDFVTSGGVLSEVYGGEVEFGRAYQLDIDGDNDLDIVNLSRTKTVVIENQEDPVGTGGDEQELTLIPNLLQSGRVFVQLDKEPNLVEVYDFGGNLISSLESVEEGYTVDHLAAGTYYIRVAVDGEVYLTKFVKL